MPDSFTPSEWLTDHFGDHSLAVMKALVAAGQAAHIRSLEAKAGSKLRTNDAYGASFWLVLPEEVVTHLTFLPGVEISRPRRVRYELVVFENAMLFPSRIGGDSAAPDSIKLRTSKVRHEMFSLESRTSLDEPLSFESLDYEEEDSGGPRYVADFGSANSLIFAAYDCSARGGLQHVYVGDATLQEDGTVVWLHREELPLRVLEDATILSLVADEIAPRFDDSAPPTTTLEIRSPGEKAEDEERADPRAEAESTGTRNDDRT